MYTFSGLFRRKPHSRFEIRGNYWVRNGSLKDKEGSKIKEGREKKYVRYYLGKCNSKYDFCDREGGG